MLVDREASTDVSESGFEMFLSDPYVEYVSEDVWVESDEIIVSMKEDVFDVIELEEKCPIVFDVFTWAIAGFDRVGDTIHVRFQLHNSSNLGTLRGSALVRSGEIAVECPDCSKLLYLITDSYEFMCNSCLQVFNQPDLFGGVEGNDSVSTIESKVQSNFVTEPEFESVRGNLNGGSLLYEQTITEKPTVVKMEYVDPLPGPETCDVLVSDEYPPVIVSSEGEIEADEVDDEGSCRFTGEVTNRKITLGATQEFEEALYLYRTPQYVSEAVLDDIRSEVKEAQ